MTANRCRVFLGGDENDLKLIVVMVTTLQTFKAFELYNEMGQLYGM